MEIRQDLVMALPERIQAIPDGITAAASHTGGWEATSAHPHIKFDSSGRCSLLLADSKFFNRNV